MQYVLTLVLSLTTLITKKSKTTFYIFLLFIWILAAFNYEIADKGNYLRDYLMAGSNIGFLNKEIGQQMSYKFFSYLGVDFKVYLGTYYLIAYMLIARPILKYSRNPGYVLLLYFIFPFSIDVAQIRNLMAMAIMLNAIPLLSIDSIKSTLKYLLITAIAITFHYSAIFYLLFIVAKYFDYKKIIKYTTIITIISSLFNESIVRMIIKYIPFLSTKILRYTTYFNVSIYTKIGIVAYFAVGLILVYIGYIKIIRRKQINEDKIKTQKDGLYSIEKIPIELAAIILKINILIFLLFPFLIYALEFIRIYRLVLVMNYLLFSNVISIYRNNMMQDLIYQFSILIFVILSFLYFVFYQFSTSVFFPIFENNLLF